MGLHKNTGTSRVFFCYFFFAANCSSRLVFQQISTRSPRHLSHQVYLLIVLTDWVFILSLHSLTFRIAYSCASFLYHVRARHYTAVLDQFFQSAFYFAGTIVSVVRGNFSILFLLTKIALETDLKSWNYSVVVFFILCFIIHWLIMVFWNFLKPHLI